MVEQSGYRRIMGAALTVGPLLIAGVIWAGPAEADAASYINDLHNAGIHDVDGGDAALLRVGQGLCDEVWYGEPPAQLAAMAVQSSNDNLGKRGLTPEQGDLLINYAIADLCPNY